MWRTVIFTLLFAYAAYLAKQRWNERQAQSSLDDYVMKHNANKILKGHKKEFDKPEVIKVTDGIYMAIGYALANSILLEGPEGAVIIDTVESMESAKKIYSEFKKVSKLPVKAIIYTHNHQDHVNGAQAFLADTKDPSKVEIWAHHTLMDIVLHTNIALGPVTFRRAMRQFGPLLPANAENSGIGIRLDYNQKSTSGMIPPNRFLYHKEKNVTIAGIPLRLIHVPGETDDQIAVYWPAKKALFCADDVYKAFPNLYAIRGTPFRSLALWTDSIDKMRQLNSEFLVPSHTRPVEGMEKIFKLLTDYRDAVQLVHDQTVRWINRGLHPDEIASRIQLPEPLANHPYLQELYGTVRWSSKGLFAGYLGWFSGEVEELNPYTPRARGKRLVQLAGGVESAVRAAETALEQEDPQWALELSQAVLRTTPGHRRATDVKAKSLFDLAKQQTSANGYNYYMTVAYETTGKIGKLEVNNDMKRSHILKMPMRNLFQSFAYRFKAEECPSLNMSLTFKFTDNVESINLIVRHGVVDMSRLGGTHPSHTNVQVTCTSVLWRQIVAQDKYAAVAFAKGDLKVKPGIASLKKFTDCLDTSI